VLDLDHCELFAVRRNVERVQDLEQPADVRGRVRQDDGVGLRVGDDRRILRDQRLQGVGDVVCVDVAERNQPRHEMVSLRAGRPVAHRLDARFLRLADRDHLDHAARSLYGRETLDLQHGLEHRVGLLDGNLGGRDDGDTAANAVVVDEVLVGQLRDRLDHGSQLDVVEVELYQPVRVRGGALSRRGGGQDGQRKEHCERSPASAIPAPAGDPVRQPHP
jgi:hypothetical protein